MKRLILLILLVPFIALGQSTVDVVGSYDGAATSGDSATAFFSSGTIEAARLPATTVYTIASGANALNTALIASTACATVVSPTATGTISTDVVTWTPNADISAVTGYAPVTTGALIIYAYPGTDVVNFKVCNPTSAGITPGAVTLNWRVER